MARYVENLRLFDSHERGILLQWATGRPFGLDERVREQIGERIDREVPGNAFVAMDFTLDWLYAAVQTTLEGVAVGRPQDWPSQRQLKASGQDVDLLVAWETADGPHTVLLEAKGFTGWKNTQMASKARRLDAIFPARHRERFDVHFLLVGPNPAKGLSTAKWPEWMKPGGRVQFLSIPDPGPKQAVQRCDETGKPTRSGYTHWQVIERKWSSKG